MMSDEVVAGLFDMIAEELLTARRRIAALETVLLARGAVTAAEIEAAVAKITEIGDLNAAVSDDPAQVELRRVRRVIQDTMTQEKEGGSDGPR